MATAEFAEQMGRLLHIPELSSYIQEVEQRLYDSLEDDSVLRPAVQDLIESGGKRIRPILLISSASIGGGQFNDRVAHGAAAVEAVHLSSLAHDDIMDKSDIRHGAESLNRRHGEAVAIMTGDALLARAYGLAAPLGEEVAKELSDTVIKMTEGQTQENKWLFRADRSIGEYNDAISKKTARLMAAACRLGGMAAGLSSVHIDALGRYGESLGMSYQLMDDVLDFTSTEQLMGKPVGSDLKQGVYSMPLLLALKGEYGDQFRPWLGRVPKVVPKAEDVTQLLIKVGAIDETVAMVRRYNDTAVEALADLPGNGVGKGLSELPGVITDMLLQKMIKPEDA